MECTQAIFAILRQMSTLKVIPAGFEPATYCLEGSCSIQLSYETLLRLPARLPPLWLRKAGPSIFCHALYPHAIAMALFGRPEL